MYSSVEPRGYRVTVNITDKRHPGPILTHVIELKAYDAPDALVQASIEAVNQGLFDPESGLDLKVVALQPSLPPYDRLMGAAKGPLDERMATFLNSRGF